MSHQTGITANNELKSFFGKCKDGKYRMVKVVIQNEQLTLADYRETHGDWDKEWDKLVGGALEDNEPCYILYRLDEKEGHTFRWIFVSWSPDTASVRNKMLYASTKASLKQEFGGGQIKDELYGNVREDLTLSGYNRHVVSESAPGPLSREEIEQQEVKAQSNVEIGVNTKHQTLSSLMFPLTSEALGAIQDIKRGTVEYVQLSIDVQKEIIEMQEKGKCSTAELPSKVPEDGARYHIFVFKHTHEGDYLESIVFIYSMPGYNCSIKERMLYSSCKNSVVERIENLEIELAKRIEVDAGSELTEEFLMDELHPKKNIARTKFDRPKPPSRGQRRITKAPPSQAS